MCGGGQDAWKMIRKKNKKKRKKKTRSEYLRLGFQPTWKKAPTMVIVRLASRWVSRIFTAIRIGRRARDLTPARGNALRA